MRGGKDGAAIIPWHPEQSLLIKLIRHEGLAKDPKPMPPKSKLSDADIATITEWIRSGAVMPADQTR
jgi:cytochrome c551/c552